MSEETPKYRAIAAEYRALVTSGALAPGTAIESRRDLAKKYKTSRVTIDKVIELLTTEKILEPSHGNRRPVVADVSRHIPTVTNRVENSAVSGRALAPNETTKILSVEMVPCPADIAQMLGVEPGTSVLCRTRLNLAEVEEVVNEDGSVETLTRPIATGYSYYPPEVTELTPELREPVSLPCPGSRELAAERMGSKQADLFVYPTARLATDRERDLLELGGTYVVVLQVARKVILEDGRTVEVAVKVHEGSRHVSFHIAL